MKRLHALIVAIAASLNGGTGAWAQCLKADAPGQVAEGTLDRQALRDAAGRPQDVFILTLSAPACLKGPEETDNVAAARTLHVFSNVETVSRRLDRFIGATVVVRGTPFGALTLHHRAPIVMDVSEIDLANGAGSPVPAREIVEPSGDPKPAYATTEEPTAQQLIETWRASNQFMPDKSVGRERFEIVRRQVVWRRYGRALLQFRILSPSGDTAAFAASRCPGRERAVELQVYYQFSRDLNAWVPLGGRGESSNGLCSDDKLWTSEQIDRALDPPPLPTPPRVSRNDVYTPPPGSPERAAIMNALRPDYEDLFGAPVVFKVEKLRIAAGFAFVVVHPQRPSGAPIEKRAWDRAMGDGCFQEREGVTHEYWMQRTGGVWSVGLRNNMCADDSIVDQGDLIGAPPQLVDQDAWREREFLPLPE